MGFGSTAGPPMLNVLYNNNYQIVQTQGRCGHRRRDEPRRAHRPADRPQAPAGRHPPLDGRQRRPVGGRHPGGRDHQLQSGREPAALHSDDASSSRQDAKVTERFTRVSADQILYEFTVDDPTAYTKAWRGEMPLNATKGPVYEYACHEGNYALPASWAARAGRKRPPARGRRRAGRSRRRPGHPRTAVILRSAAG